MGFTIKPEYQSLPWSSISPDTGDPLCTCTLCGGLIGTPDGAPLWDAHDEFCNECPICEGPFRLFDPENNREQRFHKRCFEQVTIYLQENGKENVT